MIDALLGSCKKVFLMRHVVGVLETWGIRDWVSQDPKRFPLQANLTI